MGASAISSVVVAVNMKQLPPSVQVAVGLAPPKNVTPGVQPTSMSRVDASAMAPKFIPSTPVSGPMALRPVMQPVQQTMPQGLTNVGGGFAKPISAIQTTQHGPDSKQQSAMGTAPVKDPAAALQKQQNAELTFDAKTGMVRDKNGNIVSPMDGMDMKDMKNPMGGGPMGEGGAPGNMPGGMDFPGGGPGSMPGGGGFPGGGPPQGMSFSPPPIPFGMMMTQGIFGMINNQVAMQQAMAMQTQTMLGGPPPGGMPGSSDDPATQWANYDILYEAWNAGGRIGQEPPQPSVPRPFTPTAPEKSAIQQSDTLMTKKDDLTLWAQVMGNRDRQFIRKGEPGYRAMGRGFIAGVDKEISSKETLGLSCSYNKVIMKPAQSVSKNIVNTYMVMTNYNRNMDILSAFGSFFAGLNNSITENATTKNYSYASKMEGLSLGLSKSFNVASIGIAPSLSTSGTLSQTNGYYNDSNDYTRPQATQSLSSSFALGMNYGFKTHEDLSHTINLAPNVAFNHTVTPQPVSVDLSSGSTRVSRGSNQPRLTYTTSSGYKLAQDDLSCELNYGLQLKSKFIGHSLSLKIGKKF